MELEAIIGLEIHVQLKTESKMFCSCSNDAEGKRPNAEICSVCLGHPGMLPVANKKAIEWSALTSLAINCTIDEYSKFDRKHYFYPDLPKAYQISQFDQPIGKDGYIAIGNQDTGLEEKIRINRLHLEEDAAKLTHPSKAKYSLVDYNRGGTPLMEIVTEPDITSPAQARTFLQELKTIVKYLGVSDADMEKGHLRCDANISLRPKGDKKLYPKTEIKNINSFRNVEKAIEYEMVRQEKIWLETGDGPTKLTTRGFNDAKGTTDIQREKEESHDYRYFPDPDLPPIHFVYGEHKDCNGSEITIDIDCVRANLPELPNARRKRFYVEYELSKEDAYQLAGNREISEFTDQVMSELQAWVKTLEQSKDLQVKEWETHKGKFTKLAASWMINKLMPLIESDSLWKERVGAENFAELISLIYTSKLNSTAAAQVLEEMVKTGGDPSSIMDTKGLAQISDTGEIEKLVDDVIKSNPNVVADYKGGKEKAIQSLVGQVMGKSKGKANPEVVLDMLKDKLT